MKNRDIVLPSIARYLEVVSGKETRTTYENLVRGLLGNKPLKGNFDKVAEKISNLLIKAGFNNLSNLVLDWVRFCKEQIQETGYTNGVITWKYN